MPVLEQTILIDFVSEILHAAGAPTEHARVVAASLVESNLAGHDSHGVIRTMQYVRNIEEGRIDPVARPAVARETGAVSMVDGRLAFGQVAARFAMELTLDNADKHGIAATGLYHSGHIGRLGEWAQMATERGQIGLLCNSGSNFGGIVAPFGGSKRQFSTNPISAAVPVAGREPVVVDFATSTVAEGKVRVANNSGKSIPEGWVQDSQGRPTTNPADLYDGGVLLPAAGHKGYGLALLVDFLAGSLINAGLPGTEEGTSGSFNVLFIALKIDAFSPLEAFLDTSAALCADVKANPPAAGFEEVLLPGEPEQRSAAKRSAEGIPIDEGTWNQMVDKAQEFGLSAPQ